MQKEAAYSYFFKLESSHLEVSLLNNVLNYHIWLHRNMCNLLRHTHPGSSLNSEAVNLQEQ